MKYLALLLLLTGCTHKMVPVRENFHRSDTTIIREKIVPIEVPGSNVIAVGNIDSLLNAWSIAPKNSSSDLYLADGSIVVGKKVAQLTDKTNQTRLTIFYDSLTRRISAQCETLEKTYEARLQEKETIIKEQRETFIKEQKSLGEQLKQIVTYFFVGIGLLVILIIVLGVVLYRKTGYIPRL